MKRKILLFFAIGLLFTVMFILSTSAADEKLVWLIEPEFEYDWINYCKHCDVLKNKNVSQIREIIDKYDYYKDGGGFWLAEGHGYGTAEYFFDEEKNIFAIYSHNESGAGFDYYTFDEFIKNYDSWMDGKWIVPVRKANSEKFVSDEYDGGWVRFDENYMGEYALYYGGNFITGFIYEEYESRGVRYTPNGLIDMKLNGKWGMVDKTGNTAISFIFDDIEFIDDHIAFAKYDGKYGILEFDKTINKSTNPKTGENHSVYIFNLLLISAILIIKNKYYREKNL